MEILSDVVFHGDVSIGTSTNPKSLKLYTDGHVLTIGDHTGETEMIHTSSNATIGGITAHSIRVRNIHICNYMGVEGNMSVGFDNDPRTLTLYDGNNDLTIGKTGSTEIIKTNGIAKFGIVNVDDYVSAGGFELHSGSISASIDFGTDSWNLGRIRFYQHKTGSTFYFNPRASKGNYYIATQDQIPLRESFPFSNELPIDFDVPAECTRFYVHGALNGTPASIQMFKRVSNSGEFGYKVVNVDLAWVCGSAVESDTKGCAIVVEKSSSFAMCSTDGYSIRTIYLSHC